MAVEHAYRNPFERLSDAELEELVDDALRLRLWAPPDRELIELMVEKGMPRRHARAMFQNAGLRAIAVRFWADCEAERRGDPAAAARVERVRSVWASMGS